MNGDEMVLEGGNLNEVIRINETVRRPLKKWSSTIHRLLIHLEERGFKSSPKFYGIDENNREILSFIHGETAVEYPHLKSYMMSDQVLVDVAKMLRNFHDSSISFVRDQNDEWMLSYPGTGDLEVICHNDCAPYNVVFSNQEVSAIIDFDTACPGPRIWDIVYTLYTFVPLGRFVFDSDSNQLFNYDSNIHSNNRKKRIALFFDAYGMNQPKDLIEQVLFRLESLYVS